MKDFKDIRKAFSMHVDVDAFIPATDEEKKYMVQMRPSSTFFRDGVKRLLKNKVATVSLIVIIIITLSSLFIPLFWPYAFGEQLGIQPGKPVDSSYGNLAPFEYGKTEQERIAAGEKIFPHIFGTDERGRDYFIRVVYGTRISLAVGFFASIIVLIIGMTIGSISGYCGGRGRELFPDGPDRHARGEPCGGKGEAGGSGGPGQGHGNRPAAGMPRGLRHPDRSLQNQSVRNGDPAALPPDRDRVPADDRPEARRGTPGDGRK